MKPKRINPKHILTPSLRFWYYHRGWVKLTLRPGHQLHHSKHAPTEEGWSAQAFTLTYCEDENGTPGIREEWHDSGCDCDGPISRSGARMTTLGTLAVVPAHDAGATDHLDQAGRHIMRPEWETARRTRVRDAYAEAMGY